MYTCMYVRNLLIVRVHYAYDTASTCYKYHAYNTIPYIYTILIYTIPYTFAIESSDPLEELTATQKSLLWCTRDHILNRPKLLCKYLRAAHWLHPTAVERNRQLLLRWTPRVNPLHVLELLDGHVSI